MPDRSIVVVCMCVFEMELNDIIIIIFWLAQMEVVVV